nr:hypothetical protein [Tanacetum cinerariifolium]
MNYQPVTVGNQTNPSAGFQDNFDAEKAGEKIDQQYVLFHGRQVKSQAEIYKIDMDSANNVLSMQEDETQSAEVQEVVDVVTTAKLITAASKTSTVANTNISSAKA